MQTIKLYLSYFLLLCMLVMGGFGLASIRERIGYLNGSTSLRSVPGEGTEVILSIPRDGENLP